MAIKHVTVKAPGQKLFAVADWNANHSFLHTDIDHNQTTNYVANEHIDWTNTTENLITSGSVTATTFYGDGSNLTNVGAAAASALTISVKAAENIAKGQAVYISGASGGKAEVSLADNTDNAKIDVIGLATETKTTGQTILVRVSGQLLNLDTATPGWADGDALFLSTAGSLVNTEPTSGTIRHVADVEYAHAVNGDLLVHIGRTKDKGAPANTDLFTRLGDNAGANKISYRDYANNEVAAIDSDGNITMLGTADGVDISDFKVTYDAHDHSAGDPTQVDHADLTNVTADQHHNESHNAASHSDITSSGADIDDAVSKKHTQNTDTALGSGCEAADHGAAATDQVVNVSYGTGDPPAANTTTEGSIFIKYTA